MADSRDRLMRAVDIAQVFYGTRSGTLGIFFDESRELLVSPGRRRGPMGVGGGRLRDSGFGTLGSGIRLGRSLFRSQTPALGRENAPRTGRGRGRRTGCVLPSWYPRAPLNDITGVMRAIERRRGRTGEREGLAIETPTIPEDEGDVNSNVSSGDQLEHNFSTPTPTARLKKPCPPSVRNVSNILLSVTNTDAEESDLLTPQKKLLNSIDTVGKAVMEELQKLKRTPSAKKAERQNKVHTLVSMR